MKRIGFSRNCEPKALNDSRIRRIATIGDKMTMKIIETKRGVEIMELIYQHNPDDHKEWARWIYESDDESATVLEVINMHDLTGETTGEKYYAGIYQVYYGEYLNRKKLSRAIIQSGYNKSMVIEMTTDQIRNMKINSLVNAGMYNTLLTKESSNHRELLKEMRDVKGYW